MTKSNKANAKAPTNTANFEIGDRVIAKTAATNQEEAAGTITNKSQSGWLIITLDEPDRFTGCKEGKMSARASSLKPLTEGTAPVTKTAAGTPAPAPKSKAKEKAPKAPKVPESGLCPECGEDSIEYASGEAICSECGWEGEIDDEPEETEASKMAEALKKAREHYTKDKRPDGSATAHNGDLIAKELRWYEPLEVCELADRCLLCAPGYHAERYASLNPGQKRMNSGNRIRAAYRKATEDGDEVVLARINKALNLTDTPDDSDLDSNALASIEDRGPEGIDDLRPAGE